LTTEILTGLVSPSLAINIEVQMGVVGAIRVLQVFRKKLTVLASMVSLAKTEASAANVPARVAVKMAEAPVPLLAEALRTAAGVFRGRYPAIMVFFLCF